MKGMRIMVKSLKAKIVDYLEAHDGEPVSVDDMVSCFSPDQRDDPVFVHEAVDEKIRRLSLGEIQRQYKAARTQDHRQLWLDEFPDLQERYVIMRNGKSYAVPIEQMSDDEILEKAEQKRKPGMSLIDEARQMERYVELRRLGKI